LHIVLQEFNQEGKAAMKGVNIVQLYLAAVGALLLLWSVPSHSGDTQGITAESIIRQTNGLRAERNITVLATNSILNRIAQMRLEDMLQNRYFGHTSPSGEDVAGMAGLLNYRYAFIGENLAKGNFESAADLVSSWMKSPAHRKNLLSPDYRDIGVAVALERVAGCNYWHAVQVFGTSHRRVTSR
jgi:uncharacterized protein YkwD